MENENGQHSGSTSAVISKKNLRSSKETILLSTSPFSMGEKTDSYKKLSHQAFVHDETNRMEKDSTICVDDGDGDGDDGNKLDSSSYHSRQGVNKGRGYDKDDKNKINKRGLLNVLVGVDVCMCMCMMCMICYSNLHWVNSILKTFF